MKILRSFAAFLLIATGFPVAAQQFAQVPAGILIPAGSTLQGGAGTATAITYTVGAVEQLSSQQNVKVAQGQLPGTAAAIYTPTSGYNAFLASISLNNASGSPVTNVELYVGGAAAANSIFGPVTIPAASTCLFSIGAGWACTTNGALQTAATGGTAYTAGTGLSLSSNVFSITPLISAAGPIGSATTVPAITYNAEGQLTAVTSTGIAIPCADVTNAGTGCTKNTGSTVNDPGTGALEINVPVTTTTGTSKTYAATDRGKFYLRSNSGTAMTDTLPTPVNGYTVTVYDVDATANDTISTPSGVIGNGGGSTFVMLAGRRTEFVSDGTNYYFVANNNNLLKSTGAITAGHQVVYTDTTGVLVQDGGAPATGTVTSVQCGTGLTGGTITTTGVCAVSYGTTAGTATQGNDTRIPSSVTGLRKGAGVGSNDTAAVAGADYVIPSGNITGSAGSLSATLGCGQFPALTGPVTTTAGSCADSIAAGQITNTMLATQPVDSVSCTVPLVCSVSVNTASYSINAATSSTAGSLAAADYAFLQAFESKTVLLATANQYANIKCDGTTDDSANWQTIFTNAPNNSLIVVPGCTTMLTSGTNPSIPSGKHFTIQGAGQSKTVFQSNNNSSDFITVNDWYNSFVGMTFQGLNTTVTNSVALSSTPISLTVGNTANFPASGSFYVQTNLGWTLAAYTSVTNSTTLAGVTAATSTTVAGGPITVKTGGYAINSGSNAHALVKDVQFNYVYNGWLNNGTLGFLLDSSGFGTVNFDVQFNGANVNAVVHNYSADGAPPAVAHLEVEQAGSLLISDCDLIRAQSDMRLNPTSPNGVFGVYAVNTYFDTATAVSGTANSGNGVLLQGTGNIQRIKIINSWMSSASHDGFWANSTATTLPSDIELSGDNIYSNGHDGFDWLAGQDFIVTSNQISGNVNAGIDLAASASAVTTGAIQHNQVGPAGGIGANGTGMIIAAGTYGNLDFDFNDFSGNTTASVTGLVPTVTAPNIETVEGNIGLFNCPPSQAPATVLPLTTVTEAGTSCVMRSGGRAGSWARITATLTHLSSSTATLTPTLHYGTANTNADTSLFAPATAITGTAVAGTCQVIWEMDFVTATTANVTFKYINNNNAATGCGPVSYQSGATAPVAITNINTTAYLGAYFACSVASCATVQEVKYEYGQ